MFQRGECRSLVGVVVKNIANKESCWLPVPCLPSFNYCFLPPVSTSWISLPMKAMRNCVTCCYWPSRNAQKALAWHKGGSSCHIFLLSRLGEQWEGVEPGNAPPPFPTTCVCVCVPCCPPYWREPQNPSRHWRRSRVGCNPERKRQIIYTNIYIFFGLVCIS